MAEPVTTSLLAGKSLLKLVAVMAGFQTVQGFIDYYFGSKTAGRQEEALERQIQAQKEATEEDRRYVEQKEQEERARERTDQRRAKRIARESRLSAGEQGMLDYLGSLARASTQRHLAGPGDSLLMGLPPDAAQQLMVDANRVPMSMPAAMRREGLGDYWPGA